MDEQEDIDMDDAQRYAAEQDERRQREDQAIAHARFVQARFDYINAEYCRWVKGHNERMRKL